MRGIFQFSAPKSAVDNSSELTRSLQLNEEVYITYYAIVSDILWCGYDTLYDAG